MSSRLRRAVWVALLVLTAAAPASAQDQPAESSFLSRADFSFGWASLIAADQRFDWQSTIGFDLDLYDYKSGRFRLRGHYEAVLGRERRRYDLNQGNYAFEVSGSHRFKYAEVAVLSQHVSRHVVDRDNPEEMTVTTGSDGAFTVTWPEPGMYWLETTMEDNKTSVKEAKQRRLSYVATFEVLPQ